MNKVIKLLFDNQDLNYQLFTRRLVPNIEQNNIIGVRIPILRKLVKQYLIDNDPNIFLNDLPHHYLEENIFHTEIIKTINNIDEVLLRIDEFLPYIDNWEVSDNINIKLFKQYPLKTYKYINKWLKSNKTYTLRYGIVSLIHLDFNINYFIKVNNIRSNEYYVNMAIAWYNSIALVNHYDEVISYFENKQLPKWIHNKSIQKAIESYRISESKKIYLKTLRKKSNHE